MINETNFLEKLKKTRLEYFPTFENNIVCKGWSGSLYVDYKLKTLRFKDNDKKYHFKDHDKLFNFIVQKCLKPKIKTRIIRG